MKAIKTVLADSCVSFKVAELQRAKLLGSISS